MTAVQASVARSAVRRGALVPAALGRTLACLLAVWASAVPAYGPAGHLIAGRAAEPLLCEPAARAVLALGDGEDLGELGLWADRARAMDEYADSAPWHYMNIADGVPLASFEHPPEGDVLWAIERFSARLGDERLTRAERSEALKFLVHFVVDLHQPLHVGLAADLGGNTIEFRFEGDETNLHRLWDTHLIERSGQTIARYAAEIARGLRRPDDASAREDLLSPAAWAEESLALRDFVYAFDSSRAPPAAYLDRGAEITRERLRLAALRLAATLNAVFC